MPMENILATFAQVAARPLDYVRQWKKETGGRVIGIFPMHFPGELSKRLHCAFGSNVTRTSTSLSARKSARRIEPNRANSVTFQRREKSASFSGATFKRGFTMSSCASLSHGKPSRVRPVEVRTERSKRVSFRVSFQNIWRHKAAEHGSTWQSGRSANCMRQQYLAEGGRAWQKSEEPEPRLPASQPVYLYGNSLRPSSFLRKSLPLLALTAARRWPCGECVCLSPEYLQIQTRFRVFNPNPASSRDSDLRSCQIWHDESRCLAR